MPSRGTSQRLLRRRADMRRAMFAPRRWRCHGAVESTWHGADASRRGMRHGLGVWVATPRMDLDGLLELGLSEAVRQMGDAVVIATAPHGDVVYASRSSL